MLVAIKKPNEDPVLIQIREGLKTLQDIVGGYIEIPYISRELDSNGIDMIINEEGKLNQLEANILVEHEGELIDMIVGNAIFASHDEEGNTIGLSLKQIDFLYEYLLGKIYIARNGKKFCRMKI